MKLFSIISFFILIFNITFSINVATAQQNNSTQIYEPITMENLSQLYWGLSRLDINNDTYIDNFLLINECDIYKDYIFHDFEWKKIQQGTRSYIKDNMKNFPLRFEFMQNINLGSYNMEKEEFDVIEDHKIKGIRRFYIDALDARNSICGESNVINGYPRGIILEISRPFDFQIMPLELEKAEKFITNKLESFKKLQKQLQSQNNLFQMRDVYLVLKVKIFANQGSYIAPDTSRIKALVLGVLESVEVYADKEKTDLLYSIQYRKREKKQLN